MRRKRSRRGVVAGGHQHEKYSAIDDGLANLQTFLRDYTRISANNACEFTVNNLAVWVYTDNVWTQLPTAEVNAIVDLADASQTSVCKTLMVNIFKLNETQYHTMKNSFLDMWRDVAGLYKRRNSQTDFAIVVRLPPEVPYASLIGLPIVGAVTGYGVGRIVNKLAWDAYNRHRIRTLEHDSAIQNKRYNKYTVPDTNFYDNNDDSF
jgi:hypothetical protein